MIYIAYKMNPHKWSKGFDKFWSWDIGTFWAKKITQEEKIKFIKIFKLYQVFLWQNLSILPSCVHTKSLTY